MKIGIITVHRAYNYGSVLQCYALQEYWKNLGHDVWVIDYRQRWTEAAYKPFSFYYIWQLAKRRDIHAIIGYWRDRKGRERNLRQSKQNFDSFGKKFHLTKPCYRKIPGDFDVYLIGSDQLWSYQCVGEEDKIYTGNFKRPANSRVVGYAISAGSDSLYRFGEKKLKCILGYFDKISLREAENVKIIKELTGQTLPVTVDPVLLTDSKTWEPMINKSWQSMDYIAIYQARAVSREPNYLRDKAELLAAQCNCKVVDLSNMNYTVEDFISAIKYAKYVLTTSFHATVFALLMETPCYAIKLGDGLDVRYVDLLSKLGLGQELVDKNFMPVPFSVDFDKAQNKLKEYRQESMKFLTDVLR